MTVLRAMARTCTLLLTSVGAILAGHYTGWRLLGARLNQNVFFEDFRSYEAVQFAYSGENPSEAAEALKRRLMFLEQSRATDKLVRVHHMEVALTLTKLASVSAERSHPSQKEAFQAAEEECRASGWDACDKAELLRYLLIRDPENPRLLGAVKSIDAAPSSNVAPTGMAEETAAD